MRGLRWLGLVVALGSVAMCAYDKHQQAGQQAAVDAQPLDLFNSEVPVEPEAQARQALQREAHRRQLRFIDAVRPGHRFAATRIRQAQIDAGGLSIEQLYDVGAQLFHHRFEPRDGLGGRDRPGMHRVHLGARGGPDAHRCADCHKRGGLAGAGDVSDNAFFDGDGDRPDSALVRNPIALHGAGLIELVAREMTAELQQQRDDLVAAARAANKPRSGPISAKGIAFGELRAFADGKVDYRGVRGVDHDLVVKPFGWKGHWTEVREVVELSLALHHGMQSTHLVERVGDGVQGEQRSGKRLSGPTLGPFGGEDPDGDGVQDEIGEGQVSALTLFVAMQELPQIDLPKARDQAALWSEGQRQFNSLGCARCHVTSLPLRSTVYELPSRQGGPPLRVDLAEQGATPRIAPAADGSGYRVYLFSDLKRHMLGPVLADKRAQSGVDKARFMTRPLWGLARSRPYLHDGRAPTIERAILEHGGEASPEQRRYQKLTDHERAPLRVYLSSLTRIPRVMVP